MRQIILQYTYSLILLIFVYLGQEEYDNGGESYANVKRPKAKLKKVPVHLRTGVNSGNTIQKGFKKVKKRNINVTDFDQVFDVLITFNLILLVNLCAYHIVPNLYNILPSKFNLIVV